MTQAPGHRYDIRKDREFTSQIVGRDEASRNYRRSFAAQLARERIPCPGRQPITMLCDEVVPAKD